MTFIAALVISACLACASARAAAHSTRKLTIYSIATREQFLNHSDDRTRGSGNNPFGNFKDTTTLTKESGNGPFAGDRAVFSFALFGSPDLKSRIGSATFLCTYTFNRFGFCTASYALSNGTLQGTGYFDFNAKTFEVAISAGTGKYSGVWGDLQASAAVKHTQRLDITFYG